MKSNAAIPQFILVHILILKAIQCRSVLTNTSPDSDELATPTMTRPDYRDNDYSVYSDVDEMDVMPMSLNDDEMKAFVLPSLPLSEPQEESVQLPDTANVAPEYMMELYKQYSANRLASPDSSIIRSFKNINEDNDILTSGGSQSESQTRVHTMIFNITSISMEEVIDLAELRLYTLVENDRNAYIGVDRKVSVFEVYPADDHPYNLINTKHIYGRKSNWETFDVTSAVKRWVHNLNSVQILEIRIESVFHSVSAGQMDIDTRPRTRTEPLLVVFSSDASKIRLHTKERHEMVTHEMDSFDSIDELNVTASNQSEYNTSHQRFKRRSKNRSVCRRRPMYIKFSDIDWDRWIIAPQGYQAYQCVGKCFYPLSDYLSPTKHSIIQTILHSQSPKKASRACCVPTKLDPISILYVDEQGIVTFKYNYDGMVVRECGCR